MLETDESIGGPQVNKNRIAAAGLVAAALLSLTACGSDNNAEPAATTTGATGATGALKASGSSAQKNAMAEWVNGFQTANPGVTIDYQANGSGAGVKDFINAQTDFAGSDSALKDADIAAAATRCGGNNAINEAGETGRPARVTVTRLRTAAASR